MISNIASTFHGFFADLNPSSTASITSKPNEEPSPNSGQNPSSKDTKTGKSENRKSRQCRNVSYGRSEATLRSLDEVEKSEETQNSLGRPGPLVGSQRSTPARPAHYILSLNFLNHPNLSEQLDEVFKGVFGTSQKASHVSTSPLVLFTSAPKPPTNSVICDPLSTSPGALAAFASERRRYFNWDRFLSDTIMFSDASQMMDKPPTGTNPEGFRDKLHPAKIEDFELRTPIKDTMKDK